MANKFKYMRRVFGGTSKPAIGLDQGKSILYRGDGVHSSINCIYDGGLQLRDGHRKECAKSGGINTALTLKESSIIGEGNNLWGEQV